MNLKVSKELSKHRKPEETREQIETAEELMLLVEKYINEKTM